jgi:hypothetical protein
MAQTLALHLRCPLRCEGELLVLLESSGHIGAGDKGIVSPSNRACNERMRLHVVCRRALYPALCLKNAELALNFGAAPFAHGPPPGYMGLAAAPPTSIVTGAATASGLYDVLRRRQHTLECQHLAHRHSASFRLHTSAVQQPTINMHRPHAVQLRMTTWQQQQRVACAAPRQSSWSRRVTWRSRLTRMSCSSASTWWAVSVPAICHLGHADTCA